MIEKGGHALNPCGEFYTTSNIRERLNMRACDIETDGPPAFNQTDRRNFANQLDQFLARQIKIELM